MALDACIADADATTCRAFVMAADTCFNTLPSSTSPAASCFTATDQYSAQFCGGGM
jgi:hypothetical protein